MWGRAGKLHRAFIDINRYWGFAVPTHTHRMVAATCVFQALAQALPSTPIPDVLPGL